MNTVRFQFATEDRAALLEYVRRWIWTDGPESDEELYQWVLKDMATSLEDAIEGAERSRAAVQEDEWLMVRSHASLNPERRRPLGYEILLQHWDEQFPYGPEDAPLQVRGAPVWLNRVIVVAWAGIGAYSSQPQTVPVGG